MEEQKTAFMAMMREQEVVSLSMMWELGALEIRPASMAEMRKLKALEIRTTFLAEMGELGALEIGLATMDGDGNFLERSYRDMCCSPTNKMAVAFKDSTVLSRLSSES